MKVTDLRFHPAPPDKRGSGLRGWVTVTVDGMWTFDSIAVRRAASGRYLLTFPSRRDRSGVEYSFIRPTSSEVRCAIEDAVLGELARRGFITLEPSVDRSAP